MNVKSNRKEQQAEVTRRALVAAGRELFAEHGYGGVAMEQVVARAGVTRGALYHHFKSKLELFAAVFEQVESDLTDEVAQAALAAAEEGPWEASLIGWRTFLEACQDPAVQQIVLLDGQAALGVERSREIVDRLGVALLRANIAGLIEAGELDEQPVEPLATVLTGALTESAIAIARSDDSNRTTVEMVAAIDRLMSSMRATRK